MFDSWESSDDKLEMIFQTFLPSRRLAVAPPLLLPSSAPVQLSEFLPVREEDSKVGEARRPGAITSFGWPLAASTSAQTKPREEGGATLEPNGPYGDWEGQPALTPGQRLALALFSMCDDRPLIIFREHVPIE